GAMPYIALSVFLSLYAVLLGVFGVFIARLRIGFLIFPSFYLAIELLRSSVPFGGFSWVRLGWGQVDGPLAFLAAWGGPALVTAAAATIGTSIAALLFDPSRRISKQNLKSWTVRGIALISGLIPLGLSFLAHLGVNQPQHTTDTLNVAAIQGNVPRLGLDFNAQRRAVLENHVNVTNELAASGEKVDIVLWPENSSDVNPFLDRQAPALINDAIDSVGVPISVCTLTVDDFRERIPMPLFNESAALGYFHHKKYLHPFGSTVPLGHLLIHVSDSVHLAGHFNPGAGPGVVIMGDLVVGVATCYALSFDHAFKHSIEDG